MELDDWIEEVSFNDVTWFVKRLSGNDTQLTGGHQAGPYIPRELAFALAPEFEDLSQKNLRIDVFLEVMPAAYEQLSNIIYYNNKFHENPAGGRNEMRLTRLGGKENPLLDVENTGALTIFAFNRKDNLHCKVWVCQSESEEELVEDLVGPVEPAESLIWNPEKRSRQDTSDSGPVSCQLPASDIPADWLVEFPTGLQIIEKSISLRPDGGLSVDERLTRRRDCEFEVFRSVERAFFTPKIRSGFATLEDFLALAQSVLQSRKSRAGKSLEYHAKAIFEDEGMREGIDFAYNVRIEGNKKPDFLFPSVEKYNDSSFPDSAITVLGAKTTCKDRWRQVLNEADRAKTKYLLTLQEGVSENQFAEMTSAGLCLVVPDKLHEKYPKNVRPKLMTLRGFIDRVKSVG